MSHHAHDEVHGTVALLTVSDTRTPDADASGQLARRLLESAGHHLGDYGVLPDEPDRVRQWVETCLEASASDAILVNGGTGISARDRTYEALEGLFDKRLDGFGELFRVLSFEQVGSLAMLSRAVGGISRGKPLFVIPGSPKAVGLAVERLILPVLGHMLAELRKHRADVS